MAQRTVRPTRRHPVHVFLTALFSGALFLTMADVDGNRLATADTGVNNLITVDNRRGHSSAADHTNLASAIRSVTKNTTVSIQEGVYLVDNPVILKHEGVKIEGQGRHKTIIRPQNAGKAIFKFDADHLRIEKIGINAEVVDGSGRGTFGVQIKKGSENAQVLNTTIFNTGASAIIGHAVRDSRVDGNIIQNVGDDGIHMRGDNLTITNNVIVRYFDEAIDLAGGGDLAVIGNQALSGRIGITVGGHRNVIVHGNTVDDHLFGGFHVTSKANGVVSHNVVKDSGASAYALRSLRMVNANRVEGRHRVGFAIHDMHNGVIQQNVVSNADAGFRISGSSGNIIYGNNYSGKEKQRVVLDDDSHGNHVRDNHAVPDRSRSTAPGQQKGQTDGHSDTTPVSAVKGSGPIAVHGDSKRDKKSAHTLAAFLRRHNPGFLSIQVRGNVMRSEITRDLYETLKGSGQLGIGIVRAPVRMLRRVSRAIFPVWHLICESEEIAIVTVRLAGPGAHLLFTENDASALKRLLTVSVSHLAHQLNAMFGYELDSFYYHPGKWTFVGILPLALMGVALGWHRRRMRRGH